MTAQSELNWAELRDIYGTAEAVPSLLEAAANRDDWDAEPWQELWGRLLHQGSIAPASEAALPRLIEIALAHHSVPVDPALFLVAGIFAAASSKPSGGELRRHHAAGLAALGPVARHKLKLVSDAADFAYALECVAAIEDLGHWQRDLEWLPNEEAELECSSCGELLLLEFAAVGLSARSQLEAGVSIAVVPADPSGLAEPERTLFELAESNGQGLVARRLLEIFGEIQCPTCGQLDSLAD